MEETSHNPHSVKPTLDYAATTQGSRRLFIPRESLAPRGTAVSTHPPPSSTGYRGLVAEASTPYHRHLVVAVSFLCRSHGFSPCPFTGPRCLRGVRCFLTPLYEGRRWVACLFHRVFSGLSYSMSIEGFNFSSGNRGLALPGSTPMFPLDPLRGRVFHHYS